MKYKNYIFDLYGTLIDIHTNEEKKTLWEQIAKIYACYGAFYTGQELHDTYRAMVAEEEKNLAEKTGVQYPEIKLEKVFARLLLEAKKQRETQAVIQSKKLGELTVEEVADSDWVHMLSNTFRCTSQVKFKLYDTTYSTLEALKKAGCHIYLLSNAQRVFTEAEMDKLDLTKFFDGIYISSDKGMKKPEPAFLKLLLEEYDLNPEESVMTGNDVYADIGIAKACGIDSYLLNTDGRSLRENQRRIRSLDEIPAVQQASISQVRIIQSGDIAEILSN